MESIEISLLPFTRDLAGRITEMELAGFPVAPDFPSAGSLVIAGFVLGGDMSPVTPGWPWGPWLIEAAGLVVGSAGFKGEPADGLTEIGYDVCESHRRRGIATAAVRRLTQIAREAHLRALTAETDPTNHASHAVLRNCNFTPDDAAAPVWWQLELGKVHL
jgi:GNAT superfamily N-acetyltransferase